MSITSFAKGATILLSSGVLVSICSAYQIRVNVDGQPTRFNDAQPQMIHGMVYVPIRGVFEQMGATIDWDQSQHQVLGRRGNHTLTMQAEGRDAMVDNRAVHLDGRARIIDGSVMVPLRFVSEALGSSVDWNDSAQTVDIRTEGGHFISRGLRPIKRNVGGKHDNGDKRDNGDRHDNGKRHDGG